MFDKKKPSLPEIEVDDGTLLLTSSPTINEPSWVDETVALSSFEVAFIKLQSVHELSEIVDQLLEQQKICVSLANLNKIDRLKSLNFLGGAVYALHGYLTKIKHHQYELEIPLATK